MQKTLKVVRFVGRAVIPPSLFIATISWMLLVTLSGAVAPK